MPRTVSPYSLPASYPVGKTPKLKLPKTAGATADALYAERSARLRLERAVEAMKNREAALKDHLLSLLPKAGATSISGAVATATISPSTVPHVTDWDKLYRYIRKNDAFELLQRRVSVEAWRERNDAKKPVPGTEPYVELKVHCSKKGATK